MILALLARVVSALAPGSLADAGFPPPPKVAHLVVGDSLDCAHYAGSIREAIAGAREADLIVLELRSDEARLDLAWEVAQAVAEAPGQVAVWLGDERVHPSALAIGVAAKRAFVRPECALRPGEGPRALAPEDVDWERVEREFSGLVWARLSEREAEARLARPLLDLRAPDERAWLVNEPAGARLEWSEPPARSEPILTPEGGLVLGARGMVSLRLAQGEARSIGTILSSCDLRGASVERVELRSDLPNARARVERTLAEIDAALLRADSLLERPRASAPIDPRARGRNLDEARRLAGESLARLDDLDAAIERFPEIARGPLPNETRVGEPASGWPAAWRRALQSRRDDAIDARARAMEELSR